LNILHIWDQAGVGCILAKYQKKIGHNVKVLRRSNYDPYGIYEFYKELVDFSEEKKFFETCLKEANNSDIVHIHSRTDVLFYLKKKLEKKPKIVMHFHGTDLRGIRQQHKKWLNSYFPSSILKNYRVSRLRKKNNEMAENMSDKILISTPDLKNYIKKSESILLHNPIDTDHFNKINDIKPNDTFFTFNTEATSNMEWIINFCKMNGIHNLQVIDRTRSPIMYSDMPTFLRKFGTYVDIRYINYRILKNISKTALESLACGLRVIDYDLKYKYTLPEEHDPRNVINKLEDIYKQIL